MVASGADGSAVGSERRGGSVLGTADRDAVGGARWRGGVGFLGVVAVALLLVVGLWGLARGAPSAESDPTPRPRPTATATAARGRFGVAPYPTARPVAGGRRDAAPVGMGGTGRRTLVPTPVVPRRGTGAMLGGDATGSRPPAPPEVGAQTPGPGSGPR